MHTRKHIHPLTGRDIALICLNKKRQPTRFWCGTLGSVALTDALFPLPGMSPEKKNPATTFKESRTGFQPLSPCLHFSFALCALPFALYSLIFVSHARSFVPYAHTETESERHARTRPSDLTLEVARGGEARLLRLVFCFTPSRLVCACLCPVHTPLVLCAHSAALVFTARNRIKYYTDKIVRLLFSTPFRLA